LNDEELVTLLEKCIENDLGDLGRTQYIIKRIKKKQVIFQSDRLYLDRLLKFELEREDFGYEQEDPYQTRLQTGLYNHLIKCKRCSKEIQFSDKAIREDQFWIHQRCLESPSKSPPQGKIYHVKQKELTQRKPIPPRTIIPPKVIPQKIITEKPETRYQETKRFSPEIKITAEANKPQLIFTGSLLASLVGTVYYSFGEIAAGVVGVGGASIFIATYKSQFKKPKKTEVNELDLIKTGIPGFETHLIKGLKKNSSIVLSGPAGSGKTTFGLQFLHSGAKDFDESGVYITLSQNIDDIKNDSKSFGWDFDDLIQKDKILMIDARPFKIQDGTIGKDDSLYRGEQIPFEHLTKLLLNGIKKINAQRVVIDSVTILSMQYSDKFNARQGLQGMIQALENSGVTCLIISESSNNEVPLEWFVTSGIIQLQHTRRDDIMERTIQITKMRGINHSEQVHPIALGSDGLYIFEARQST
jgi:circadian clock protein KaiC